MELPDLENIPSTLLVNNAMPGTPATDTTPAKLHVELPPLQLVKVWVVRLIVTEFVPVMVILKGLLKAGVDTDPLENVSVSALKSIPVANAPVGNAKAKSANNATRVICFCSLNVRRSELNPSSRYGHFLSAGEFCARTGNPQPRQTRILEQSNS